MFKVDSIYKRGAVELKIQGADALLQRLDKLRNDLQYRLLVDAMKRSLSSMMQEAEARAPIGPAIERTNRKNRDKPRYSNVPGFLKRSFRLRKVRSDNPFVLEVRLENTAFYALWVEEGHKLVRRNKRTKQKRVVGRTRPARYMLGAFNSQHQRVVNNITDEINTALTRRGL